MDAQRKAIHAKMGDKKKHTPWHKEAKKGFPNSKKPESVFGPGAFNKGDTKPKKWTKKDSDNLRGK